MVVSAKLRWGVFVGVGGLVAVAMVIIGLNFRNCGEVPPGVGVNLPPIDSPTLTATERQTIQTRLTELFKKAIEKNGQEGLLRDEGVLNYAHELKGRGLSKGALEGIAETSLKEALSQVRNGVQDRPYNRNGSMAGVIQAKSCACACGGGAVYGASCDSAWAQWFCTVVLGCTWSVVWDF